jgi:signal transduction histidine kinase
VLLRRTELRLGLQAAGIVSVIVLLLTATAGLVLLRGQHRAANALLSQALVRADDVDDPPSGVWLAERRPDGTVRTTSGAPTGLALADAVRRTGATGLLEPFDLRLAGDEYRVQTVRRPDGYTYVAAMDLRANHTERDRLLGAMLGAGAVCLLLAAAAGAWLGRRATEPLGTALALQRRFVGDAGHELRTPLTLLSTRAQLLRRRLRAAEVDPEVLAETDRVVADTRRLATILDDLLLAADPTAARSAERVDLAALAAEVVAEAAPVGAQRSIRITAPDTAVPDPSDPSDPLDTALLDTAVRGSPTALRRAITALVDNAVRHADHQVEVAVRRDRRRVVLEVVDDGPGVDPELAPRMFDRFVSGPGRDAPEVDGRRHYGLGLALVSDIVASHGGNIELAVGGRPGTAFRITLPGYR